MILNARPANGALGSALIRRRSDGRRRPRPPRRDGDARHVDRRRQVVDHRVEQRLHALVLERGAAQHRTERAGDRAGLDAALQGVDRDVALVEIFLHRRVIDRRARCRAGAGGIPSPAPPDRRGSVRSWNCAPSSPPSQMIGLHLDQVHHAEELVLDADRQLQRQRHDVELLLQRGEGAEEVGAGAVQLVDEDDARDVVAVGETPVGLRLRLHAGDALDDEDRAVQHAQAAVHLDVEVDVARRVDDVDPVVLPLAGHGGRGDGDAPLPLLVHVIGRGVAVVHLADPVRHPGVIEDPLGRGGLARVDMRGDADIADLVERRARHGEPPYHDGRPGTPAPRARMLIRLWAAGYVPQSDAAPPRDLQGLSTGAEVKA